MSDIHTHAPASGSPPAKVDTDALERSLGGLVDTLMKRWGLGTGTEAEVPIDLADGMRAIAETLTSLLSHNDVRWTIVTIASDCDIERRPWLFERRWRVLENLFNGVAKDGRKEKQN